MTIRQSILKAFYPFFMRAGKMFGLRAGTRKNQDNVKPILSFYDLSITTGNGTVIDFKELKGKDVLIVNTASGCGYTKQLSSLNQLQQSYKNQLVVIGFPSNDFKEQEKLSDKEIASFCAINFGVTFPLASKSVVIKSEEQNRVYAWLSDKHKNGWSDIAPEWNFSKYLVNKTGSLTHYFGPGVEPLSKDVTECLTTKRITQVCKSDGTI
jgi:glutathione peroxidase